MLEKLEVERLHGLLSLVRTMYSGPTQYHWVDDLGQGRQIRQQEGGEQGDPLMPLRFCLAVRKALGDVPAELLSGEKVVCLSGRRVRVFAGTVSPDPQFIGRHVAVQSKYPVAHQKRREPGTESEKGHMEDMGPEVWNPQGLKVLATPVGTWQFHEAASQERLAEEEDFWRCIPWVPDLQCAWQLLVQCAGPRCYHFLRTVPHDRGMEQVMSTLLEGLIGDARRQEVARRAASLPRRMGGLGLRSALKTAPAVCWASWADVLPMIDGRLPQVAQLVTAQLEQVDEAVGCMGEIQRATRVLDLGGFVSRPS